KDIIPLYLDPEARQPNITKGLVNAIARQIGLPELAPEDVAAYVYAILSTPHYHELFAEELKTPGPRVPITADTVLWSEAVAVGRWLIWLHTYAERFQDLGEGRDKHVPFVVGIGWTKPVVNMPQTLADITYDPENQSLMVGDGHIMGVREDVWSYAVSGMSIVKKWLGYRTVRGAGRAASSKNPLDQIRPVTWLDAWNDELLDLLRVLTLTLNKNIEQIRLLDSICDSPLIMAVDLPVPKFAERKSID
ncbi:MAG: hypothetical protein M0Z85_02620, partial [Gammaproteobacteria bacterium]|nr:hypothetical protein [Gammaproteobacteria bacterium]